MSFFKMDESKVLTGGGAIKEGDYEVIITDAKHKLSSTNKDMIVVDYEVRSDIQQEYQGWKLRFNNFMFDVDENTRKLKNGFTNKLLYACGWAVGNKPGISLDVKDMDDMAQQLVGKTLVVTVEHEEYVDKQDGSTKKRGVAKFTNRSKLNESANNVSNGPIDVSEDVLPF